MQQVILKTRAMQRLEQRLGQPLERWLAERYRTATQAEIAEELGLTATTVNRWMRDLGIEARFPGQRPRR